MGEAVQQLADRLSFHGVHQPAVQLLRDTAAHAEVDPSSCALLPQVNVLWGLEGTPPLVSLIRPELGAADHAALKRLWDGAARCYLEGHRTTSLTKAFDHTPRPIILWLKKLTGRYPYRLSRDPGSVLLAVSSFYVNEAWCYHDNGVEFVSPINGNLVRARGEVVTTFLGYPRSHVKGWVSVPVKDHQLMHIPSVGAGSTLRALLEQALFVYDHHTLRIAHMLEVAGVNLGVLADKLERCKPRPPQSTMDIIDGRPSRAHKTLREVLGIGFDVPAASLTDQIDPLLLQVDKPEPQGVCVAALYRHIVEEQRLTTTGRFVAYYGRTVPQSEWLDTVDIHPRTLQRWLYKPVGTQPNR